MPWLGSNQVVHSLVLDQQLQPLQDPGKEVAEEKAL
jgi:hypothetical protein